MQGITTTIVGTGITQYDMDALTALNIGLLAKSVTGGDWFAHWADKTPTDRVYVYTFDGIYGGFIYGEPANFETLAEFAECAYDMARDIWSSYLVETDDYLVAAGFPL